MELTTKNIKRHSWTYDDEVQLLKIWKLYASELRQAKHNAHIYAKISRKMGGKFSAHVVHCKITNLTYRYRCEKKKSDSSDNSTPKWEHFHNIEKIIENKDGATKSFANTCSNQSASNLSYASVPNNSSMQLKSFASFSPCSSTSEEVSSNSTAADSSEILAPKKFTRRVKWSSDDELKLLQIWEVYASELRQSKRNAHIYAKISEEMGGKFSANIVHTKITNLVCRYRAEKKEKGLSDEVPSKWEHFKYIKKIIESNADNKNAALGTFETKFLSSNSNSLAASEVSSNSIKLPTSFVPINPVAPTEPTQLSRTPLPSSSPPSLLATPVSPVPDPLTSNSSKRKKSYSEVMENINKIMKQGEEQLQILRNVAQDTRNICEQFSTFLEYFKKFLEKN